MRRSALFSLILLLPACAQYSDTAMTVDAADSGNIADFHQSDGQPVKLWEQAPTKEPARNIRARAAYEPAQGPMAAIGAIHRQLHRACPAGWRKEEEWTQAEGEQFYLYIAAQCRPSP